MFIKRSSILKQVFQVQTSQFFTTIRNWYMLIRYLWALNKSSWIWIFDSRFLHVSRKSTPWTTTAKNVVVSPNFVVWNFLERHSFRILSDESPKTMRKLCFSTKSLHQDIRWNYCFLRSVQHWFKQRYIVKVTRKNCSQYSLIYHF